MSLKKHPNFALLAGLAALLASAISLRADDPRLQQSLGASWSYTDNRDGVSSHPQGESDYTLNYRADYLLRDGDRSQLDLLFAPACRWRSNPPESAGSLSANHAALLGSLGFEFSHALTPRCSLAFGDILSCSDGSSGSSGSTTDSPQRNRALSLANNAHLSSTFLLTTTESLSLSGAYSSTRYLGDTQQDNTDADTLSGSATFGRELDPSCKLLLQAGVIRQLEQASSTGRNSGSQTLSSSAGAEKLFDPNLAGSLMLGWQTAQNAEPGAPRSQSLSANASLTLGAATPTRGHFGFSYGLEASNLEGYANRKILTGSAGVDHELIPGRLVVGLQGVCSISQYEGQGLGLSSGSDRVTTMSITGSYLLAPRWTLNSSLTHTDWHSELRDSFRSNRIMLALVTNF